MQDTDEVVKSSPFMTKPFGVACLVVGLGIIFTLATVLFNVLTNERASTQRAQCEAKLKTIALALEVHRQEVGVYSDSLNALQKKHFLQGEDVLHCPADLRKEGSYDNFYGIRAPYDTPDSPTVVCPLHESLNGQGVQAFKGNYTKQFITRPAVLEQASGATVERFGQPPVAAVAGATLHGGDRIRTAAGGAAMIRFADNSSSELQGNSDVTFLQSFVSSPSTGTLYTLVRQSLGIVRHNVSFGSKFDVVTKKATVGAGGGVLQINVPVIGTNSLTVIGGSVSLSTLKRRYAGGAGVTYPF